MNTGDVVSGRAKLKGILWALLSVAAHKVLVDQLRALLPVRATVGPCLLREARFKPGRKITAYYDALVNTENPGGHHVRPIAVTWRPSTRADRNAEHEETLGLAKIQAEAVRHRGGSTLPGTDGGSSRVEHAYTGLATGSAIHPACSCVGSALRARYARGDLRGG